MPTTIILIVVIIVIAAGIAIYIISRKKSRKKKRKKAKKKAKRAEKRKKAKKKEKEEISGDIALNKALALIKKEKRITQKEIRKNMNMSEAKISLIITDLEDRGLVKRIKRGRGNIIIYSGK